MKDKVVDLAKKLMAVPSVSRDKEKLRVALELASVELDGFGCEVFESNGVESRLFYVGKTRPEKFRVILNGHLDVVPAGSELFKPRVRGGKLWGRGSNDMKAAIAAEVLAFARVADKVDYPLGLQLVTDEEVGGFDGTVYQLEQGVKADFVLIGEPTKFRVGKEAKGIYWLKAEVFGETAHAAYPWKGRNAILKAVEALEKLRQKYPAPKEARWETVVSPTKIDVGENANNQVPERCEVVLDARFVKRDEEGLVANIRECFPEDAKLEVLLKGAARHVDSGNGYVSSLERLIVEKLGKELKPRQTHGSSDARFYSEAGIDCVNFGPMGDGSHSDEEWVGVSGLVDYQEILEEWLVGLDHRS